jgi:hypothetical protein
VVPFAVALAGDVALPAEELADVRLQGGLHDQPVARGGDVLQDLGQGWSMASSA